MKINEKIKFIIDTVQWVLIIILGGVCIYQANKYKSETDKFLIERRDNAYKLIYYGQNINELKEVNKELYNTIDSLSNVESAVQIKFVYKYNTDTITIKDINTNIEDSTYNYHFTNDTITFNMTAKAKELYWLKGDFKVKDNFKIVTQNDNDKISTTVHNSQYSEIENVTAWRKKNKWYNNIYIGPTVGFGYGLTSNKVDVFVGASIGYKFR